MNMNDCGDEISVIVRCFHYTHAGKSRSDLHGGT